MRVLYTDSEGEIKLSPEASRVKEFKRLWEADTSEDKNYAKDVLAFIYFLVSVHPDNPMRNYNTEERIEELRDMFPDLDMTDENLIMAKDRYLKWEQQASISLSYVRTIIRNMGKLKEFLDNVDLDERTESGALVYNTKQHIDNLSNTTKLVKTLAELERQVLNEELMNDGKLRGDGREEFDL